MVIIDQIFQLYQNLGQSAYFGEQISQQAHALQSAALALADNSADTLIVAALLHDVGHLLHSGPENIAGQGIDTRHEMIGARWLQRHFGEAVSEPVRLHVNAKRYLCATDKDYYNELSPASQISFRLQGGHLDSAAVQRFLQSPYAEDAVRLRRFDDQAKVPELEVPPLAHYRSYLLQLVR